MNHFEDRPITALIQGASRGLGAEFVGRFLRSREDAVVFATSRNPRASEQLTSLRAQYGDRLHLLALDVSSEPSIEQASQGVRGLLPNGRDLNVLMNVSGLLHDDATGMQPERSLKQLDEAHLMRSFRVNTIGPMLMAKYFAPLFPRREHALFVNMSARVGSITDNRLGGWYAYRCAKAAQNQFTKTLSIEMARRHKGTVCVALHPGTVNTGLSEPFQGNVPQDKLFSVPQAVDYLWEVMSGLTIAQTGHFYDWAGEAIEW